MAELTVPRLDFSTLGELPDVYRRNRFQASRDMTLANLGQDASYSDAARGLVRAGDLEGGISLAKLDRALRPETGVYGTPIYGTDAQGNTVVGAIGKNGQFVKIDTGGVTPTPGGIKTLDTGTGFVPFDPRLGRVTGAPIPKTGEVSRDYQPVTGPDGSVSAAPIPGTPAAQKIADDATRGAARAEQTVATGNIVKDTIKTTRERVNAAPFYNPAVGMGAETAASIGGSNAADVAQLTETIKANIGFDRLQRMREESPTGGALGQVAVQELQALQATLGSLSQSQSKAQFNANLTRLERIYDGIIRKASAYPNAAQYGFGAQAARPQPGPSRQPQQITSKQQFDALPSGTQFIAPDGSVRVKP